MLRIKRWNVNVFVTLGDTQWYSGATPDCAWSALSLLLGLQCLWSDLSLLLARIHSALGALFSPE